MKTPNGKPTRLTERQWVQVRTPAFKKWFGDWERKAELHHAVDFALNGTPVSSITGNEFAQTGKNDLVDRVASFYASVGGKVENPDIGEVILDRKSVKSSLAHGIGREKAAAFAAVPDVIRNGFIFDRQNDWKGRKLDSMVIVAPIKIGNEGYVCEAIVEERADGKERRFYLHEVNLQSALSDTIKTPTGGASAGKPSRPVRSILAKLVLEFNPENASKVVDEDGEPLVVYHGTLKKGLTRFDPDLVGSRYSYDEKGFFFIDRKTLANDYATSEFDSSRKGEVIPAFLSLKDPLIVNNAWGAENGLGSRVFDDKDAIEFWDNYQSLMLEKSEGQDGIIIDDGTSKMVVAFEPEQIKSATDNNGDFSSENDDIRWDTPKLDIDSRPQGESLFDGYLDELLETGNAKADARTPQNPLGQIVPPPDGSVAQAIDAEIAADEARAARSAGRAQGVPPAPAPGSPGNERLDPGYEPESLGAGVKDPVSRQEIVDKFRELFADTVAIRGKNTTRIGKNFDGHYEPGAGIIRSKDPVSLRTIPHEIGHHIEATIGIHGPMRSNAVKSELFALGKKLYGAKKPVGGYQSEGFAEVVKYYLQGNELP